MAATAFCYGYYGLAQRVYDAAYKGWFMFASPILSNAPEGTWSTYSYKRKEFWEDGYDRQILWKGTKEPSIDRKSTRLNSSHVAISYAVFCLKKKICTE